MSTILIILIILLLVGAFGAAPYWGHSQQWGWGPSGGVSTILIVLLVLYLLGVFR